MKRTKLVGIIALILAGVVLLVGVFSLLLRGDNGLFASMLDSSIAAKTATQSAAANVKNAESAQRKADTALDHAQSAVEDTREAQASLLETLDVLRAHTEDGDPLHDLYVEVTRAQEGVQSALSSLDALIAQSVDPLQDDALDALGQDMEASVQSLAQAEQSTGMLLLNNLRNALADAEASVDKAETSGEDARSALVAVWDALSDRAPTDLEAFAPSNSIPEDLLSTVAAEAETLVAKAQWLLGNAQENGRIAQEALSIARDTQANVHISNMDRWIDRLATYYIAIWFTGLLLLAIGIVLTFFAEPFLRQWRKNPVFSTFMALVVMLIVQVYAMKFTYASFGEWAKFWFDNAFNVLRANTSVGIIALGMTLVIITGGIDLAVGSTLAGVGTVLMVLIDTSPRGILLSLGITGIPAYILGILGGFAAGALIGALIGLGVTKGRVPPFIITLGVMNIVRSVAQYFTKSYTPKVPSAFTAISNTVIFGQRLLPILYWLVLAVLLYLVMQRTRFGRYVYAVGSNERTSRLSGINVSKVKFQVYTLMGFLVSVAAVTQVSRLGGMDVASSGSGYELDAIAAVVVGGTSMSGGRGSIVGTVIGVLIIGVMNNLLILLGVDSFLTNAFKGAIVVAAVLMQRKDKEG